MIIDLGKEDPLGRNPHPWLFLSRLVGSGCMGPSALIEEFGFQHLLRLEAGGLLAT